MGVSVNKITAKDSGPCVKCGHVECSRQCPMVDMTIRDGDKSCMVELVVRIHVECMRLLLG